MVVGRGVEKEVRKYGTERKRENKEGQAKGAFLSYLKPSGRQELNKDGENLCCSLALACFLLCPENPSSSTELPHLSFPHHSVLFFPLFTPLFYQILDAERALEVP